MAETSITATINVDKAKCMDDLLELSECMGEIFELIPDHLNYLAKPHTDKIEKIITSWIKCE